MRGRVVALTVGILSALAGAAVWWSTRPAMDAPVVSPRAGRPWVPDPPAPPGLAAAPPRPVDLGPVTCRIAGVVRRAGRPAVASVEARRAADAPLRPITGELHAWMIGGDMAREAPVLARTTSAGDGTYRFASLPTGAYVVRAVADDGARGAAVARLRILSASASVDVELLRPDAVVKGKVAYDDGAPWKGSVEVASQPDTDSMRDDEREGPVGSTDVVRVDTGTDGTFEAHGLTPGACRVTIEFAGLRVSRTTESPSQGPVLLTVPRRLDAAEAIVVAHAAGEPVTGARVGWSTSAGPESLALSTATDAEGRFRVPDTRSAWTSVVARGFARYEHRHGRREPFEARIELDRTVTVRGRAILASDGRPASRVTVEASTGSLHSAGTSPDGRAVTDADGRYEIAGLEAGEVRIRARAPGLVARGTSDLPEDQFFDTLAIDALSVQVAAGGDATLDVVMEPAARVVGRLADGAGRPAAGIEVEASRPRAWTLGGDPAPSTHWSVSYGLTDDDGRYAIDDLVPGWSYAVTAARGAESARGWLVAPEGGGEAVLDLAFPPSVTFEAQVVDAETGAGVPGLALVATPSSYGRGWTGRTGGEGRVRIGPMIREAVVVEASRDGSWSLADTQFPAPPEGSEPAPRTIRATRGPPANERDRAWASEFVEALDAKRDAEGTNPLAVRVVDGEGRVVPRADVRWSVEDSGSGTNGRAALVDGTVSVPRPAGRRTSTTVVVTRAQAGDGSALALGSAQGGPVSETVGSVEVRLPPTKSVVGRVVDAEGRGVAGLRMRWVLASRAEPVDFFGGRGEPLVRTDAEGRFSIDGVGEGEGWVAFPVPDRFAEAPPVAATPGGAPVEIRLHASVDVWVWVLAPGDKGIEGFHVYASSSDLDRLGGATGWAWSPRHVSGETGASGITRLKGLDPEHRYRLFLTRRLNSRDEPSTEVADWTPADTAVRFRAARTYRGVVRDPAGKPVGGVSVIGFAGREHVARATTDAAGAFALEDAGVGTEPLWIVATTTEWGRGSESRVVAAPEGDDPIALVLDPRTEVVVRLEGESVGHRTVRVTSDASAGWDAAEYASLDTDEGGVVRFRGLRADRAYAIWVGPMWRAGPGYDDLTALIEGVRAASPTTEVRVRLDHGGRIRAHLPDPLLPRAYVHAEWAGMRVEGVTNEFGDATVNGLCDVEWTIVAEGSTSGVRAEGKGRPGETVILTVVPKKER